MARRKPAEWDAHIKGLVRDGRPMELAEVVANEALLQSDQTARIVDLMVAQNALLAELVGELKGLREQTASVDHHVQRIHGAHEREEIFKVRASKVDGMFSLYPLSQHDDVSEYERVLIRIEDYEARKERIINGTVGQLPARSDHGGRSCAP